jgi:hypothetical protein
MPAPTPAPAATATLAEAALVQDPKPVGPAPLEEGKVLRFNAPFGSLYHPWDNTEFTPDGETKHVVDAWVNLQFTAGKLVLAAE